MDGGELPNGFFSQCRNPCDRHQGKSKSEGYKGFDNVQEALRQFERIEKRKDTSVSSAAETFGFARKRAEKGRGRNHFREDVIWYLLDDEGGPELQPGRVYAWNNAVGRHT